MGALIPLGAVYEYAGVAEVTRANTEAGETFD